MFSARRSALPVLLTISALTLTACGGGDQGATSPETAGGGALRIVAATNVYGDIAAAVGGDDVEVTSIVDSLSQDPHSYEPTVQDRLAVSEADVVIENGGGYDTFLERLADESDVATVLNVVELSGLQDEDHDDDEEHADDEDHADEEHTDDDGHGHSHGEFNEHVWYNLPVMVSLANTLAQELGRLDDANANAYQERAEAFAESLQPIQDRLGDLASAESGRTVAVTEPVPLYLLEAAGLENATPEEFSEAIEEERDVPVAVLEEMRELVAGGTAAFLAYNEQTESPQTEMIRSEAESSGLPVLNFTETLPDGEDFVSWMSANTDSIEDVLNS